MVKIKQYLLNNFTKSFLTLFIPFFIIISLIYNLKIAKLSAKITLSFYDFATLYLYFLPDIIFATVPLTFIGAIINSLTNLSQTNETTALFSIGYSPKSLIKFFLPIAILFTIFTTITSIFIIPYTTQSLNNFKAQKIYESKLKILPKKLSQNFGNQHIFIQENNNGIFKDVTMFSKQKDGNVQILIAQKGAIKNNNINSSSYLSLDNGILYRYKSDKFTIIDFKNMKLFSNSKYYSKKIINTKEFWKKYRKKFYYYILISLSPLFLLILYISFGIYNPRYSKNLSSVYIFISVLLIYNPAILARKYDSIYIVIATLFIWIVISILIFNKKLLKRY